MYCDDVKFGESRNAVPSKGFFETRGQKIEENVFFVILSSYVVISSTGLYIVTNPHPQINPPKSPLERWSVGFKIH